MSISGLSSIPRNLMLEKFEKEHKSPEFIEAFKFLTFDLDPSDQSQLEIVSGFLQPYDPYDVRHKLQDLFKLYGYFMGVYDGHPIERFIEQIEFNLSHSLTSFDWSKKTTREMVVSELTREAFNDLVDLDMMECICSVCVHGWSDETLNHLFLNTNYMWKDEREIDKCYMVGMSSKNCLIKYQKVREYMRAKDLITHKASDLDGEGSYNRKLKEIESSEESVSYDEAYKEVSRVKLLVSAEALKLEKYDRYLHRDFEHFQESKELLKIYKAIWKNLIKRRARYQAMLHSSKKHLKSHLEKYLNGKMNLKQRLETFIKRHAKLHPSDEHLKTHLEKYWIRKKVLKEKLETLNKQRAKYQEKLHSSKKHLKSHLEKYWIGKKVLNQRLETLNEAKKKYDVVMKQIDELSRDHYSQYYTQRPIMIRWLYNIMEEEFWHSISLTISRRISDKLAQIPQPPKPQKIQKEPKEQKRPNFDLLSSISSLSMSVGATSSEFSEQ